MNEKLKRFLRNNAFGAKGQHRAGPTDKDFFGLWSKEDRAKNKIETAMSREYVTLSRNSLRAERWLLTNRIPMEVCESQDDEGNECLDRVFLTDEGHQLVMREDNNDTMSFFLKSPDGEMKIVEPNAVTARFCSFVPMKDGQVDGASVFITCHD